MPEKASPCCNCEHHFATASRLEPNIFRAICAKQPTAATGAIDRLWIGTIERHAHRHGGACISLARAGACRSVPEIRERLTAEGYEGVFSHLNGMSIKRQLIAALVARGVTGPVDSDDD